MMIPKLAVPNACSRVSRETLPSLSSFNDTDTADGLSSSFAIEPMSAEVGMDVLLCTFSMPCNEKSLSAIARGRISCNPSERETSEWSEVLAVGAEAAYMRVSGFNFLPNRDLLL